MSRILKNFINGGLRDSIGGRVQDLNPADVSDVVAEAPTSTAEEAAEACEAAANAFDGWRQAVSFTGSNDVGIGLYGARPPHAA